jgi:hypothetical protein
MHPLDDSVLVDLEHERLLRQAAAFEARLRQGGDEPAAAGPGPLRMIRSIRGDRALLEAQRLASLAEFDGFSCGAQRTLDGPLPNAEAIMLGRRLERTAAARGEAKAVAFAHALVGQAALQGGYLRLASSELSQAAELHHANGSSAGEANALLNLAEVRFAQGEREAGWRLLEQALPRARWSRRGRHLLARVYGAMVTATDDPMAAMVLIGSAEKLLRIDSCASCYLAFALPALSASADAGDLRAARHYAELVWRASRLWAGTAVEAAVSEALAHRAYAEGTDPMPHLELAVAAFDSARRPLDVRRVMTLRRRLVAAA